MEEYLNKSYVYQGLTFKVIEVSIETAVIKLTTGAMQSVSPDQLRQIATEEVPESCDLNEGCDSCGS